MVYCVDLVVELDEVSKDAENVNAANTWAPLVSERSWLKIMGFETSNVSSDKLNRPNATSVSLLCTRYGECYVKSRTHVKTSF